MLKKLYKHEFYSLFRTMLPVYIGLVGLAVFSRLFFLLDDSITVIRFIQKSMITLFVLGIIVMFGIGLAIVVMRFYRNLLSHEGYLTFSLPFTAGQHILCKLVCGAVVILLNFLCLLLSLLILFTGQGLSDFLRMATDVFARAFEEAGGSFLLLLAEIALFALSALAAALLMTYVSMAIGQQFKNRIATSIAAYIGIYAVLQTVGMVVIAIASEVLPLPNWLIENVMLQAHLILAVLIIWQLALALIYFFVTRRLLTRRLNLA